MKKVVLFALAFLLSTNATMAAEDIVIGGPNTVAKSAATPHPQALSRFFENALFHNVSDPVAGNPKGTVSLAEFFDYQCIHCIAMAPVISELAEKNPNLKVVFKVYSLGRPSSTRAALAAIASEKQGKFLDFHYALLTANKPLNDDVIFSIASSVGLNVAELQKDMNSPATEGKLNANLKLAQDLKIPGTPAVFIAPSNSSGKQDATTYFYGEANNASLQSAITKAAK